MGTVLCSAVAANFPTNADRMAIMVETSAATTPIRIKKVRITSGDGTETTTPDYHKRIKFGLTSNTTSGSNQTPKVVNRSRNWYWTSSRIGPGTGYTIDTTIDTFSIHSATDFVWQAADDEDKIVVPSGTSFIVEINPAG